MNSKAEKIAALLFEQKSINQLTTRLNSQLTTNMPSLKEQVNHWIEEEIKFLESEQTIVKHLKPESKQKTKFKLLYLSQNFHS